MCSALVSGGGYCPEHASDIEEARGTSTARGYGVHWRRVRAGYIRSRGPDPSCENCGRTEADAGPLEVDHLDGKGPTGNNQWSNLQLLCKPCHSTKTAAQTRGAQP